MEGIAVIGLGLLALSWPAIAILGLAFIFAMHCVLYAISPMRDAFGGARQYHRRAAPEVRMLLWLAATAIIIFAGTTAAISLGFDLALGPTSEVAVAKWLIALGTCAWGAWLLGRAFRLHRDLRRGATPSWAARSASL